MRYYQDDVLREIENRIPHFIATFLAVTPNTMEVNIHIEAGHYDPSGARIEQGWHPANVDVPHSHGYVEESDIVSAVEDLKLYLSQNSNNMLKNILKF